MDRTSNRLAEQLLETIEDHIVSGDYAPGTRLDEVELAESHGVSRTPIREALIQLAALGMIEKRPRKGWVVTEVSPNSLFEMFEVMAELEAICGRLAARRATRFQIETIKAAHEACRNISDPDAYYRLNEVFHQALYDASQNPFLAEQARALQRRVSPFRRLQLRVPDRIPGSFREHAEVVEAIEAGDSARAEQALRAHVVVQGQRFSDLVESVQRLTASGALVRA